MPGFTELFNAASAARLNAYAPYSNFKVGAALITEGSTVIHSGCNVETANSRGGNCAEGGAIASMIASGGRVIKDILIVGDGHEAHMPCGHCRQLIHEFADAKTRVHIFSEQGLYLASRTVDALLPDSGALKKRTCNAPTQP